MSGTVNLEWSGFHVHFLKNELPQIGTTYVCGCNELQRVDQQCQCAAMQQVYQEAQQMRERQGGLFGGQKIQKLKEKAHNVPNKCNVQLHPWSLPTVITIIITEDNLPFLYRNHLRICPFLKLPPSKKTHVSTHTHIANSMFD